MEGLDGIEHKLDVLRGHCDALGRDYDAIRKTLLFHGDPLTDPDGFLRAMESYAGLDGLIFNTPYVHELETVELIGTTLGPLRVTAGRSSAG